jgi:aspartate carbamoyltransferase catalytic subunit
MPRFFCESQGVRTEDRNGSPWFADRYYRSGFLSLRASSFLKKRYHLTLNARCLLRSIIMQEFSEFESLLRRPSDEKNLEFQRHGRLKHIIAASQLTPPLLDKLCRSADLIRRMNRHPEGNRRLRELLAHQRAMLYFTQPSTRTFLSFMAACQILGVACNEVRDPKTSSEVKRESKMDSIRMFSSYFDVIIMRSQIGDFAECCAYLMNDLERQERRSVPIINAGAGSDEHPTQALLDMYTIIRTFDFDENSESRPSRLGELRQFYPGLTAGPSRKTYAFCGDIGRGRTVRSLATVLSQYEGVKLVFISPQHDVLVMDDELRQRLKSAGAEVHEAHSLDSEINGSSLLGQIDCLYMTRIQREHNSSDTEQEIAALDLEPYRLTLERVGKLKQYTPIMHPFPRDCVVGEIPTEIDSDPRAMYFRQARNGMWARAALLVHLFDAADSLYFAYSDVMRSRV